MVWRIATTAAAYKRALGYSVPMRMSRCETGAARFAHRAARGFELPTDSLTVLLLLCCRTAAVSVAAAAVLNSCHTMRSCPCYRRARLDPADPNCLLCALHSYWNHRWVVDWSGATSNFTVPMEMALFVPIQLLHGRVRWTKSCCEPSQSACKGTQLACFVDVDARGNRDCCSERGRSGATSAALPSSLRHLREQMSVPAAKKGSPWIPEIKTRN